MSIVNGGTAERRNGGTLTLSDLPYDCPEKIPSILSAVAIGDLAFGHIPPFRLGGAGYGRGSAVPP
jgi:hypothetical protein